MPDNRTAAATNVHFVLSIRPITNHEENKMD